MWLSGYGGPVTLKHLLQSLLKHFLWVQHPQNSVWSPTNDHSGPENTVLGQKKWDKWRLSDTELERIDLENAANHEEADELEEMTADETIATTCLQVLHATNVNRAGKSLPCGMDMGFLRQPESPCSPLYSQMGVSTPSFVPTSLSTTRDSY